MLPVSDQLAAAVNGNRAGDVTDICREEKGRHDQRLGGIERLGERGQMLLHARRTHLSTTQYLQEVVVEIEATVVREKLACRNVPAAHRWILETRHEQQMRRYPSGEEPGDDL